MSDDPEHGKNQFEGVLTLVKKHTFACRWANFNASRKVSYKNASALYLYMSALSANQK